MHSSLVCIFATEMALYITCDVSPLSKVHRMLTLDTETLSMLISTVEAVRPKAISKQCFAIIAAWLFASICAF